MSIIIILYIHKVQHECCKTHTTCMHMHAHAYPHTVSWKSYDVALFVVGSRHQMNCKLSSSFIWVDENNNPVSRPDESLNFFHSINGKRYICKGYNRSTQTVDDGGEQYALKVFVFGKDKYYIKYFGISVYLQ